MASSACRRSLTAISKRCISNRPKAIPSSPFATTTNTSSLRRLSTKFAAIAMLGSLDTMLPLHSTIAAARLKSNIAVDTSCWSCISHGFATPR